MTAWKPGETRRKLKLEEPYPYVAPHLLGPLKDWVFGGFEQYDGLLKYVMNELRLPMIGEPRAGSTAAYVANQQLLDRVGSDANFLLTITEAIVPILWELDVSRLDDLLLILDSSNSLFEINGDHSGLRERIDPTAQAALTKAVQDGQTTSVGEHLTRAWNGAYGLTKDASKAYSEAIKAVEAAAAPVLEPSNPKATLGSMIKVITNKPAQWKFVIEGGGDTSMERVAGTMSLLWQGQTSRHGGLTPTRPETDAEAQAAVHLAATLCQWFQSGAIEKR